MLTNHTPHFSRPTKLSSGPTKLLSRSTKLPYGHTKLSSGPTKLSSGLTKLSSGPTKLSSGFKTVVRTYRTSSGLTKRCQPQLLINKPAPPRQRNDLPGELVRCSDWVTDWGQLAVTHPPWMRPTYSTLVTPAWCIVLRVPQPSV